MDAEAPIDTQGKTTATWPGSITGSLCNSDGEGQAGVSEDRACGVEG